jgi:energy-coupling factor transporter transmembrane protein EcfT
MLTRRAHPVIPALFVGAYLAALLTATLVERVILAGLVMCLLMVHHRSFQRGFAEIRIFLPFLVLYTLIGSLFGQGTVHTSPILWNGPTWEGMGHLLVTEASLRAAGERALTLFTLMALLFLVGRNLSLEDTTFWLRRAFPRIALTLGMVVQFMPSLLMERDRIAALFAVRDQRWTAETRARTSSLRQRMNALQRMTTVYRVLLMNALERSWTFAESLYVRGYGAAHRTRYQHARWNVSDTQSCVCLAIVGVCLFLPLAFHVLQWGELPMSLWTLAKVCTLSGLIWTGIGGITHARD